MKLRFSASLATVSLIWATAWSLPAATPPAEKLLPADTLVMTTIPDWDRAAAAFKDFPFVQLWRDPAMKPFADHFEKRLGALFAAEDKNAAAEWAEFKPLLGGQITLALVQNGWQGQPGSSPDVVVLIDVKDKARQLRDFIEKCEKRDADAGKVIQHETVRRVKFARTRGKAPQPKDNEAAGKPKSEHYAGQSGSLLLVAENLKSLEKILARLDGAGAGLDEVPEFERARSALARDAQVFAWLNAKALLGVVGKLPAGPQGADANPLAMAPGRMLDALGLGGLDGVALTARPATEGTQVELFLQSPQARRKGLLSILTPEVKEAGPLPSVGGDVAKFTRVRLDGQKAFTTLERVITDLNPQMAGLLTLMLENVGKDKNPNFDLRKELFGNLGADFVTIQKAPRGGAAEDLKSPPTLYLIGSPRPDALVQALRTLSPLPPKEREFLGRKVYSLSILPGMVQAPPGRGQLNVSTTGGYVAVATDVAMLEEVLRGAEAQGKPLSAVPGLAETAQKIGGFNTGWFVYENQTETLRILLDTLRKDPDALEKLFASPLPMAGATLPSLKPLKDLADFSLLPPFAVIAKYLGYTVQTATGTPDGISFKSFVPVPAGLKK
ncbi:MAG: hypothetical protein B9S33_16360 [Pedosphaera sp. Tous-C6FEB]|nr:MAG: hypothetical protein B9S33_16360 [Pedosphaera sp. Tous-C6FEB]